MDVTVQIRHVSWLRYPDLCQDRRAFLLSCPCPFPAKINNARENWPRYHFPAPPESREISDEKPNFHKTRSYQTSDGYLVCFNENWTYTRVRQQKGLDNSEAQVSIHSMSKQASGPTLWVKVKEWGTSKNIKNGNGWTCKLPGALTHEQWLTIRYTYNISSEAAAFSTASSTWDNCTWG